MAMTYKPSKVDKLIQLVVRGEMHYVIRAEAKRNKMTMTKLLRTRISQWPTYRADAIAYNRQMAALDRARNPRNARRRLDEDETIDDLLDDPQK